MSPQPPRILEIGDLQYCKMLYPEQTRSLWTGWRPSSTVPADAYSDCTPRAFAAAMRDAAAGAFDVVVAYMGQRSSWLPRYWGRALAREPHRPVATVSRVSGVAWLRWAQLRVPLVVLDMNDTFGIGAHNFFLLDKADIVFKRELPADRWHVLYGSAHPNLPTKRIRGSARWQWRLAKIEPLALPAPAVDPALIGSSFPEKTSDVFFAGAVTINNWVRQTGIAELRELAARGIRVDIPEQRLPPAQFYRRLASSWLAWSPAGYSWECYRTGEAAQCLSVPLVNHPTVERHRPLLDRVHLFQYGVEPGGLTCAIVEALADKARLRTMAFAARDHVLKHHTLKALVDHVLDRALRGPPMSG